LLRLREELTFDDLLIWELVKTDTRVGGGGSESKKLFNLVGWATGSVGGRHDGILDVVKDEAEGEAEGSWWLDSVRSESGGRRLGWYVAEARNGVCNRSASCLSCSSRADSDE
jgi:hypothetical protein